MKQDAEKIQEYVMKFPDGKYVAKDQASGGYPTPVDYKRSESFTLEDARKYKSMFPELTICLATAVIYTEEAM